VPDKCALSVRSKHVDRSGVNSQLKELTGPGLKWSMSSLAHAREKNVQCFASWFFRNTTDDPSNSFQHQRSIAVHSAFQLCHWQIIANAKSPYRRLSEAWSRLRIITTSRDRTQSPSS